MFNPETKRQCGSMEAHRLTATEEISVYRQCWENDGSYVLGQCRRDTYSLRSQGYNSDGWDLLRCVTKLLPPLREKSPKKLQLCSFITTTLLLPIERLVFTSFSTTLKFFLMLHTHLTSHQAIFGSLQHRRTHFVVSHFTSFRSCNSNFPVVTTNP